MQNFTPIVRCLVLLLALAGTALQVQGQYILTVNEPSSLAGTRITVSPALFGPGNYQCAVPVSGSVVFSADTSANPVLGCFPFTNSAEVSGKIAMVDRGTCGFIEKALHAQNAGAIAVIVCNNDVANPSARINMTGVDPNVTIPAFSVSYSDCQTIRTAVPGLNVTLGLNVEFPQSTDNVLWGANEGEGDFAGGFNGWTAVNYSICTITASDPNFTLWQYSPTASITGGCGGQTILSPTGCNGAAVFSSDYYDNAAIACGVAIDSLCSAPQLGSIISPTISMADFGDVAGISVSFYQTLRHFTNSAYYLGWSTDGGITWDSIAINSDRDRYPVNAGSAGVAPIINPDNVRIPLPSGVLDADSLKIKFTYNGNYYYWLIDDVKIIEREANNLQVNSNFFAVPQNAITPLSQVESIGFLADVSNVGAVDQNDVNLNITITKDGDGVIFTDDLSYGTIPSDSTVENIPFATEYTPNEIGSYTGTYLISSNTEDFDESNNSRTFQFAVSDTVFAKEFGQTGTVFPAFAAGATHSWAMGNHFHVVNGTDANGEQLYISSVAFGIGNASAAGVAGKTLIVQVYEWVDLNENEVADPDERVSLGFTFYDIKGTELPGDLIVLPFPEAGEDPIPLQDNTDYIVMLEYSTGDAVDVQFSTGRTIDYGAMIYYNNTIINRPRYGALLGVADDLTNEPYSTEGFSGSRYSIVPRVRMHITGGSTVNTNNLALPENSFALSPNPTSDVLRVAFNMEQPTAETTIRIFSINGKLLAKQELQRLQNETLEFNVNNFPAGTYFLQVETEKVRRTKKFVVAK